MEDKKFQEQLKEELPSIIDKIFSNEQITEFITYLLENGWETYNSDILDDICKYGLTESFYKDGVELGLVQLLVHSTENKLEVGIDPSSCYDKARRCSIVAELPMSKRDYNRFIKKLESVTNGKERQQWFKEAPSSWYGAYASYGVE